MSKSQGEILAQLRDDISQVRRHFLYSSIPVATPRDMETVCYLLERVLAYVDANTDKKP